MLRQLIGDNENCRKGDFTKGCNRAQGRKLHVDSDNTMLFPQGTESVPIFSKDGIGGPHTATLEWHTFFLQPRAKTVG